MVNGEWIKQ